MAAAFRRLQQMGEPETWSIGLNPHDIRWSEQSRSMRMFHEKYGHRLPLLIQVTEGFDGIDGFHTFSSGDIYWVSGIHSQPRVIVKDRRNRNLSIPLNYGGLFNIVYKDDKSKKNSPLTMTLGDAVTKWQTSIENFNIELHDDGDVRVNVQLNTENVCCLGLLEIVDTYDELSLIGYSIFRAGVMCKQPCLIPLYVEIQVCVSKSHAIANLYDEFIAELKQITDDLPPREMQASHDVIMFGENMQKSEYNYVVPHGYTEFPVLPISPTYDYCQLTPTPAQQQQRNPTTSSSYEKVHNSSNSSGTIKSSASGGANTNSTTSPPRLPPARPPKHPLLATSASGSGQQATTAPVDYRPRTAGAKGPPVAVRSISTSTAAATDAATKAANEKRRPSEPLPSADQSHAYYNTTPMSRRQSENEYHMTTIHSRSQPSGRPPVPSSMPNVPSTITESAKPATTPKSTNSVPRQPPSNNFNNSVRNNNLVESLTQQFNNINCRSTTNSDDGEGGGDIYVSLADVPRKVEHMTAAQLASAVSHIFPKNPEYAQKLGEMEVDGQIVKDITKEILVSELGFSQVDALKMTKFVRDGWKPERNTKLT